jgi:hypothetical protein
MLVCMFERNLYRSGSGAQEASYRVSRTLPLAVSLPKPEADYSGDRGTVLP